VNIEELLSKLEPLPMDLTEDQLENLAPQLVLSIAISLKRLADLAEKLS